MKKNRNSAYFNDLNSIINSLAKNLNLEKGLKVSSLCKLWSKVVGPRFEKTSKIFSIYENNGFDTVIIAVSSASVSQELNIYKNDILRKVFKLGKNFGFNIKEIKFSTKFWKSEENTAGKKAEITPITEKDLENIEIPLDILISLENSLNDDNLDNKELKEKFLRTVIKDLKTQIWLKNNGFPLCAECGVPLSLNNPQEERLCPVCKYSNNHSKI